METDFAKKFNKKKSDERKYLSKLGNIDLKTRREEVLNGIADGKINYFRVFASRDY